MSWDAVIVRIRGPFRPITDVEAGDFLPLGTSDTVASAVRAAFPDAQWDRPTYAHRRLDADTGMTIELANVETSHSIDVMVSGPGNSIPDLLALANANGWVVVDCSSGEFIEPCSVESKGFAGYKSMWDNLHGRGGLARNNPSCDDPQRRDEDAALSLSWTRVPGYSDLPPVYLKMAPGIDGE